MSRPHPARIATVRVLPSASSEVSTESEATRRLAVVLLAGSPRVSVAGSLLVRVDARGWDRRGGEPALAWTLSRAVRHAGFEEIGIGIADVPVAADAAAWLAASGALPADEADAERAGVRIVAPGKAAEFLAPLSLSALPLPTEILDTFRALGLRRIGEIARQSAEELEARFGAIGLRAYELARGTDERPFLALDLPGVPEAGLELDMPADTLEPLLFVLRHLLARVCADLQGRGYCAARLELSLRSARGVETATVVPARPTRRERLLYDLCRAGLERAAGVAGRLTEPVEELVLRVVRTAPADARQGDLFTRRWRNPLAAASALSRLRARLGEDAVVRPRVRADHRPEARSEWIPVEVGTRCAAGTTDTARVDSPSPDSAGIPGVLHLLPKPVPLDVRTEDNRPVELRSGGKSRWIVAAEGPERLSGDWWKDPYHREYFRVCTEDGGLLWLFREYRPSGVLRWWLHGWWD